MTASAKRLPKEKPTIFIGSSSKSADVADAVFRFFDDFAEPQHWKDMFPPGETTIETLLGIAQKCDFAILIMGADDTVISENGEQIAVRDNVLFELGLFMSSIGHRRSFMLEEYSHGKIPIKIASDIVGITRARFERRKGGDMLGSIRAACTNIKTAIAAQGKASKTVPLPLRAFNPVGDEWFRDYAFDHKGRCLWDWPNPRNVDLNRGLSLYWLAHDLLWTVCVLITFKNPNQIRRGLIGIAWQLEQSGLMHDKFYNDIRELVEERDFVEDAWDTDARAELAAWLFESAHGVGDTLNRHYRSLGCPGKVYFPLPPRPEIPANMVELAPFGFEVGRTRNRTGQIGEAGNAKPSGRGRPK